MYSRKLIHSMALTSKTTNLDQTVKGLFFTSSDFVNGFLSGLSHFKTSSLLTELQMHIWDVKQNKWGKQWVSSNQTPDDSLHQPPCSLASLYYASSLTQLGAINLPLQSPHNLLLPKQFLKPQLMYSLSVHQSELSVKIHMAHLQHQMNTAVFKLKIHFLNIHVKVQFRQHYFLQLIFL